MSKRDPDQWLRNAFTSGRPATEAAGCPDDGRIWDAARGQLPPEDVRTILAHSLDCAACKQSWLAASALADEAGLGDDPDLSSRAGAPAVRSTTRASGGGVTPFPQRHRALLLTAAALAASLFVVLVGVSISRRDAGSLAPLEARVDTTLWKVGHAVPLLDGDPLQVGDRVYLKVSSATPLYVYVINIDDSGEPAVLFPVEGARRQNPVPPGEAVRLPGNVDQAYDSWQVSSTGGRESFTVVAALSPLEDLENILGRLDAASPPDAVTRGPDATTSPGDHGAGAREQLARALRDLRRDPSRGIMIRETVLKNPGTSD